MTEDIPEPGLLFMALGGVLYLSMMTGACVLYGAPFALATDRRPLTAGTTFTLGPGEQLRVGGTPRLVRAYLCVRGGIAGPVVLGSRSGLAPLRAGDGAPFVRWQGQVVSLFPWLAGQFKSCTV